MADFTSNLQSFEPSISFLDADPSMGLINQFPELNQIVIESSNLSFQSFMSFSNDNLFTKQLSDFSGNLEENFPCIFHHDDKNDIPVSGHFVSGGDFQESKKRKAIDASESSSGYSTPPASENGITRQNVRRGKINERLRCLKDIVPGCYKTMGMAVMLDEIINYVHSLQNQVEFLSMKLTAASNFYGFNSERDAIETLQLAKAYEAQKVQRIVRGGYEGLASTQLGLFDLSFGCCPSLPHNT
ncbi:unnamed protein product [Ilex paraguariensis]|uniref:BHLH domain-containing protein n=1 Tax=Ilex paraguariensis TaxID=185542 RepID=A0ABC8UKZ6_9AQUA